MRRANGAFWSTATVVASSIKLVKAWGRKYLTLRSIGGTGTFRTHVDSGSTRAVGRIDLTGLAGACGEQVAAGQ